MEPTHLIFNQSLDLLFDFILSKNYSRVVVLADENTKKYCLPLVEQHCPKDIIDGYIFLRAGEHFKNLDSCSLVWNKLLDLKADRNSLLINLGGGMITDLGAYAASCYKRGIDFINVPTSLIGMIDAAIGGKTGINFRNLKNQIGLFNNAVMVFIYPDFQKTLEEPHLKSGFGETIKYALLHGHYLFNELIGYSDYRITNHVIQQCIDIKQAIVLEDFEENGKRKLLNLGHTVGHALESYFIDEAGEKLYHGEAVAHGILVESILARDVNGFPVAQLEMISQLIKKHFGILHLDKVRIQKIVGLMKHDKKNSAGNINFSLLKEIGVADYNFYITPHQIEDALMEYTML